jgi:hypothetical protein
MVHHAANKQWNNLEEVLHCFKLIALKLLQIIQGKLRSQKTKGASCHTFFYNVWQNYM